MQSKQYTIYYRRFLGLLLAYWILATAYCFAQSPIGTGTKIDSLKKVLLTAKEDTNKVNHLNALGWEYKYRNHDTSYILLKQALSLSEKIKWEKGIANSLGNIGGYNLDKGDYPKALDYYFKALKINESLNNKTGIAKRLSNIGIVYAEQADYPKALGYYFKALKMAEELGYKQLQASNLSNIGIVYMEQGDYPKALDYYFGALKMAEELGNKNGIAITLGNIGNVYNEQGDYPKALDYYFKALQMDEELGDKRSEAINLGNIGSAYKEQAESAGRSPASSRSDSLYNKALDYYFKALKINEELGDKDGIANNLSNIGSVYNEQASAAKSRYGVIGSDLSREARDSLYNKALDYYFKALKINEELGDKDGIAITLGNIGTVYTETGKYKEAEKYLLEALKIDKEIGKQNEERQFEEQLSKLYEKMAASPLTPLQRRGEFAFNSLEHYKKAMALKDTLFSQEKNKELTRKEMNYEFEKKEAAAKAEADKQSAVAAAESRKQKMVILLVMVVLLVVAVFAVFIFRALRITQKQKKLIEAQKKLVEEKQNEILASIRYAKRIQTSLLPTEKYIDKTFKRLMKR